jgi:hypothetical protein
MASTELAVPDLSAITTCADVERLEQALLQMPQADIVTVHSFPPGKYERKIIIPPRCVLTGAAHKTDYTVRVEAGTISVNTEGGIKTFTAPAEFQAKAGIKRAGAVHAEEVVWVDIYDNPDDCLDIAALEERLYVVPECGLGETRRQTAEAAKIDFARFMAQIGLSEEVMDRIVNADDLIPMPEGVPVEVRTSIIHGSGLFACRAFDAGATICPGRLGGHRTPAGRFTNHSPTPNAAPVKVGDDIYAVALRRIASGEEVTVDYRDSMLVNFGVVVQGVTP